MGSETHPIGPQERTDKRNAACGFSLLELVLVLVIIGIIASVTVPRVAKALAVQRLEAAANRIAADIALTQRQARITSVAKKIGFEVDSNRYGLSGVRHLDRASAIYTVNLADEPYGTELISADFDGDAELIFDGYGVPDSGGVLLISCGVESIQITVAAETGAVTTTRVWFEEPDPDPPPGDGQDPIPDPPEEGGGGQEVD